VFERTSFPFDNPYAISGTSNISDAFTAMEKTGIGGVVVVGRENHVVGTLTDGDVRRAILDGKSYSASISSIANSDFFSVRDDDPPAKALSIAKANLLSFIPILDMQNTLVGIFLQNKRLSSGISDTPVLVMAGGLGLRMGALTRKRPKPLLEVNGLPLIDGVIGTAVACGFRRFFVSTNFMAEQIEEHLSMSIPSGVECEFITEETPMGTAGAVGKMKGRFDNTLLVINADVIHNVNLSNLLDQHEKEGSELSIVTMEHELQFPFGVLEIQNNRVVSIEEKPRLKNWVSAGIYAISASIFDSYDFKGPCDMTEVAEHLIASSRTVSPYVYGGFWRDLGTPTALEEVSKAFNEEV
jgi:dTDP-glucose pyrophosphorylase